jgi:hypothetical protein
MGYFSWLGVGLEFPTLEKRGKGVRIAGGNPQGNLPGKLCLPRAVPGPRNVAEPLSAHQSKTTQEWVVLLWWRFLQGIRTPEKKRGGREKKLVLARVTFERKS